MKILHHIASNWFALLLLAHLAPTSLAQAPSDSTFLPEGLPAAPGAAQAGIEATGDTVEVRALTAWAEEHRQSDPEQAQKVAERTLVLARELNDQRGIGESLMILGKLASDLLQEEAYYREAQETFAQTGFEHGLNYSRLGLGSVYRRRGELEQALTFYFDALEGFKRLGDTEGQAAALNSIGVAHKGQDNLQEAVAYYEQAATLAETLDNPPLLATILVNLGAVLAGQGSHERAETTYRRALVISEEEGLRVYVAAISNNLGLVYNDQGRYEQALQPLLTARRLNEELGRIEGLIPVYDELGKVYMGLGEYDRALSYAGESLRLARETESLSRQMEAHATLSEIYEAAGNPAQALVHYRQYAATKDSVFTAEKAEIITEMQTRYETEEKQRAIERLEQENRIQALQTSRWRAWMFAGMGGLLLVLGVLFYRYRVKQKANRLLEELDIAKSRFFANISHEFRTPLTVILGELQDALAGRFGALSDQLAGRHRAMLRNTRRLQYLVDEVLDLNRLEAGELELNPAPGDLVQSIKRIIEADAPLAERSGIDLTFETDTESCPRLYDQEKLEKIVGNLLSNALKFTPKGGEVRVGLRCGERTEVVVADNGPGIPEDAQERVFERFTQAENGSLHGGTGIGLALAKELAELHGGTITLESEPEEGSAFTVQLPLEEAAISDVEFQGAFRETPLPPNVPPKVEGDFNASGDGLPDSNLSQQSLITESASVVAKPGTRNPQHAPDRTTVLIIEDNADVRSYVRRSLQETYRVLEAADGKNGLQQARTALPDLIVSDVMLPGIDGYEIARQLKATPETECIPLVMLTARAAEEDQTKGYGSGAEVYITKPFSPETLRAACMRLLEERRRLRKRLQEDTHQKENEAAQDEQATLSDRARAIVLDNLHNEEFGVNELAGALGMSRRTLYRRLEPEAGFSPSDFVQNIRLERARQLLSNGAGSVSEVAYAVGFKSLSHFTHSFREYYEELPSRTLGTQVNEAKG